MVMSGSPLPRTYVRSAVDPAIAAPSTDLGSGRPSLRAIEYSRTALGPPGDVGAGLSGADLFAAHSVRRRRWPPGACVGVVVRPGSVGRGGASGSGGVAPVPPVGARRRSRGRLTGAGDHLTDGIDGPVHV